MGARLSSHNLQIVGLNVNTSCIKQVGGSLGTQRTVRVALPCYLLGRARSPSGPVLWRACSTVFHACGPGAFREITQLEGSWVRWFFRPPRCCPRTSEVGTDLRAVRCCGGPALRCPMPADLTLSEKSPHLEGSWVRWVFRPPRCCPRTSEVGTDLRVVRLCRRWLSFSEIALFTGFSPASSVSEFSDVRGFLLVIPTPKNKSASDIIIITKNVEKYSSKDTHPTNYGQILPALVPKRGVRLEWQLDSGQCFWGVLR